MADNPQLQLFEIIELTPDTLRCTVRGVSGEVRVGSVVELRPATGHPIAGNLTISAMEFAGGLRTDAVDQGRTALVTVTGSIHEPALRAVTRENDPTHVVAADLRLVVL